MENQEIIHELKDIKTYLSYIVAFIFGALLALAILSVYKVLKGETIDNNDTKIIIVRNIMLFTFVKKESFEMLV